MKIAGVALLVLVAYFLWRFMVAGDGLVLLTQDSGRRVAGSVKHVLPEREILLEIINNDRENSITEITLSRQQVNRLGLSQPAGFREEPLPLTESDRKNDELVEFVEEFNDKNVRWVGRLELEPNAVTELAVPATSASGLQGYMDIQYEARVGFGGSISSFRVHLSDVAPETL